MKELVIDGKSYVLKYGFEATLEPECIGLVFDFMALEDEPDVAKALSGLPKMATKLFYYSLLECNPVENIEEAKKLLKQYFFENKGISFSSFITMLINLMNDDEYINLIGLDQKQEKTNNKEVNEKKATTKTNKKEVLEDGEKS